MPSFNHLTVFLTFLTILQRPTADQFVVHHHHSVSQRRGSPVSERPVRQWWLTERKEKVRLRNENYKQNWYKLQKITLGWRVCLWFNLGPSTSSLRVKNLTSVALLACYVHCIWKGCELGYPTGWTEPQRLSAYGHRLILRALNRCKSWTQFRSESYVASLNGGHFLTRSDFRFLFGSRAIIMWDESKTWSRMY